MPEILKKVMEQVPNMAAPAQQAPPAPDKMPGVTTPQDGGGGREWIQHWKQVVPDSPSDEQYDYEAAYEAKSPPTQGPDGKFRWPIQFKKGKIPTTKGVSVDKITKTADEIAGQ